MRKYHDTAAVALFLLLAFGILLRSYVAPDGYVTPDSAQYLALANNLLSGDGFFMKHTLTAQPFAIWPPLYPVLIFLTAKLLHTDVFLASKILNIALLGLLFYIVRKMFRKDWLFPLLLLSSASLLKVATYTWSELLFTVILLLFALLLARLAEEGEALAVCGVILLGTLLFFVRYVGLFGILTAGVALIIFARQKGWKKGFFPMVLLMGGFAAIFAYLVNNRYHTGHFTGLLRIPAPEKLGELVATFFSALGAELAVAILVTVILLLFRVRGGLSLRSFGLIAVAVIYFLSLFALRVRSHFDPFGYRLLFPGVVLLLLASADQWMALLREQGKRRLLLFLAVAALGVCVAEVGKTVEKASGKPAYRDNMAVITEKYRMVPPGSLVVYPERHLHYLRQDIGTATPYYTPYFPEQESWADFQVRTAHYPHIYLNMDNDWEKKGFHASVKEAVKGYGAGKSGLVQTR